MYEDPTLNNPTRFAIIHEPTWPFSITQISSLL